jgi:hypothetical protein
MHQQSPAGLQSSPAPQRAQTIRRGMAGLSSTGRLVDFMVVRFWSKNRCSVHECLRGGHHFAGGHHEDIHASPAAHDRFCHDGCGGRWRARCARERRHLGAAGGRPRVHEVRNDRDRERRPLPLDQGGPRRLRLQLDRRQSAERDDFVSHAGGSDRRRSGERSVHAQRRQGCPQLHGLRGQGRRPAGRGAHARGGMAQGPGRHGAADGRRPAVALCEERRGGARAPAADAQGRARE